jgi:hypothetical protein
MLSPDQRKRYWVELHAVLEKVGTVPARQGPPRGPLGKVGCNDPLPPSAQDISAFRETFHAQHNLPASTKDFTRAHFDTFLAACRAITQPNDLAPQLRALDSPKTRLLHKILVEQAAQLKALGIPDPSAYIAKISQDKFRGRNPADLSESNRSVFGSQYSQLDMLKFTIARAISELRQQKGWTVHELLWASGLAQTCECAACRKGGVRARLAKTSARTASEELANAPF